MLTGAVPTIWLADADGIKFVMSETRIFQKDVDAYKALEFYGQNVVTTEGSDWRRHRRIATPAFNEAGNAFVWKETVRIVNEWFAELDTRAQAVGGARAPFTINAQQALVQATFLVISSAGFGRCASWNEDQAAMPPPGHALAFPTAMAAALTNLHNKVLIPSWLYALCARVGIPIVGRIVRETQAAYDALRAHMLELVALSRAWVVTGKVTGDLDAVLLRNLVKANMAVLDSEETDSTQAQAHAREIKSLTEDELFSNMFTFLLAGHETSAHSLSFAVALLALYPDVQRRIYEEALRLWPDGVPTTASTSSYKESMSQLPYTLATFHETLRLFPAVVRIAKVAHADTAVKAHHFDTNAKGAVETETVAEMSVPIAAGSVIMVDIRALHHNPMYWGNDVYEFRPERFIDTPSYRWPRDAYMPFSAGPRSCIGQRFAQTESTCLLASLVRTYEISVPDALRAAPFEEQRRTILSWKPGVTMTPTKCFVQLRRRTLRPSATEENE
ncbi:cytochrome P450 [Mycena pura]|uniref:Cytochrome P450 n=1 Tax=Mycena pura TaxID=153505 RepID=A0AAD6YE28_9AGAR|nr:cytochrome P450 [Mycena pura]